MTSERFSRFENWILSSGVIDWSLGTVMAGAVAIGFFASRPQQTITRSDVTGDGIQDIVLMEKTSGTYSVSVQVRMPNGLYQECKVVVYRDGNGRQIVYLEKGKEIVYSGNLSEFEQRLGYKLPELK